MARKKKEIAIVPKSETPAVEIQEAPTGAGTPDDSVSDEEALAAIDAIEEEALENAERDKIIAIAKAAPYKVIDVNGMATGALEQKLKMLLDQGYTIHMGLGTKIVLSHVAAGALG